MALGIGSNLTIIIGTVYYSDITSILFFSLGFLVLYTFGVVIFLFDIFKKATLNFSDFSTFPRNMLWIFGNMFSAWLIMFIDRQFIMLYLDDKSLSIYSLSVLLITLSIMTLYTILTTFFVAVLKKYLREHKKNVRELFQAFSLCLTMLILPVCLGLSIYGKEFIIKYSGIEFIESFDYLLPLSVGLFLSVSVYLYQEYMSTALDNGLKVIFFAFLFGAGVNIFLNYIWILEYGLWGVSYASLAGYMTSVIIILSFAWYRVPFFAYMKDMGAGYALAFCVWGLGYLLWQDEYGFWGMWIFCIGSMLVYWGAIYIVMKKKVVASILFLKSIER